MGYDRYKRYRVNGQVYVPAQVKIQPKSSDYFEVYNRGASRLDLISNDYYGDPGYDWLILMANPELPDLEYQIPNGTVLRIPYPLDRTIENINNEIDKQESLYGINKQR